MDSKENQCKWTNLQNRNRVTDVENKHSYQKEKGEKDQLGGWGWQIHISIYN